MPFYKLLGLKTGSIIFTLDGFNWVGKENYWFCLGCSLVTSGTRLDTGLGVQSQLTADEIWSQNEHNDGDAPSLKPGKVRKCSRVSRLSHFCGHI